MKWKEWCSSVCSADALVAGDALSAAASIGLRTSLNVDVVVAAEASGKGAGVGTHDVKGMKWLFEEAKGLFPFDIVIINGCWSLVNPFGKEFTML